MSFYRDYRPGEGPVRGVMYAFLFLACLAATAGIIAAIVTH